MTEIQLTEEQQEAFRQFCKHIVELAQEIMEKIHAALQEIQWAFQAWIHPIYRWWIMAYPAYLEWQAQKRLEYWWLRSAQHQWILPE